MGNIHYALNPTSVGSLVGFERMIDSINRNQQINQSQNNYPPYNIAKVSDDQYRIEIACAGFSQDDFDIELKEAVLTVTAEKTEDDETQYVFKGIAARPFKRTFTLADTIEVRGVTLDQGMLIINLLDVIPEEKRAKKFIVNGGDEEYKSMQKSLLQESD